MAEKSNGFDESLRSLLNGLDGFVSSKTVVGNPIEINDSLILPLMDVSIGVGAGAYGNKATSTGGGMGAKMSPSAVLILQNGAAKLVNIKNQDPVSKVLEIVPDVIDKISGKFVKKDADVDKAVEDLKEEYK